MPRNRLRAVSLFLEICGEERKTSSRSSVPVSMTCIRTAMLQGASSAGVGKLAKRETALVSYSDLDARHSGDGEILLVGLRSYDTHLSVTFTSDMQRTAKLCCYVCLPRCDSCG